MRFTKCYDFLPCDRPCRRIVFYNKRICLYWTYISCILNFLFLWLLLLFFKNSRLFFDRKWLTKKVQECKYLMNSYLNFGFTATMPESFFILATYSKLIKKFLLRGYIFSIKEEKKIIICTLHNIYLHR